MLAGCRGKGSFCRLATMARRRFACAPYFSSKAEGRVLCSHPAEEGVRFERPTALAKDECSAGHSCGWIVCHCAMERFRVNRYLHLAVYAAVCLLTLSCDQSFEPIEPSELQFSVFGYLDASADTQWIRLMPIRSTVITSQAALDVAVQLENLSSGHVIVMRDSVFQFTQHNDDVGSDGHFLHNFWTNQEIAPGSSFRFEARGGDGVPSVGEITVPPDYRVELWLWQPQPRSAESDRIRLLGLRHVAFVTLITEGRDACGPWTEYRHFPVPENDSDTHVIPVNRGVSRLACPPSVIDRQDLRVVGSSAPWPKGDGFETGGLGVTDAPSNVSHAVGFLGCRGEDDSGAAVGPNGREQHRLSL